MGNCKKISKIKKLELLNELDIILPIISFWETNKNFHRNWLLFTRNFELFAWINF